MKKGYIALRGVAFGYEDNELFHNLNLTIQHDSRLGIIGPNGTGKSTLLTLIKQETTPVEGEIEYVGKIKWGEVAQRHKESELTVWQWLEQVPSELGPLKQTLTTIEDQMSKGNYTEETLEHYAEIQEQYTNQGGYTLQNDIHQILTGLGLPKKLWEAPLGHLSSGQRTKVALASVLLEEPDIMLLDEPTNYLDMESMEWLEYFLTNQWKKGFIVVSHDRYFLERVCTSTLEMAPGKIPEYYGSSYSTAMRERERRITSKQSAFDRAYAEQLRQEEIIRRLRAGSRASTAQSRMKQLDKQVLPEKPHIQPIPHITLRKGETPPDILLSIRDLCIGHDKDSPLFFTESLQLRPKQRIAIMGPNGAGKTTLLKTLLGAMPILDGMFHFGKAVQKSYFSQEYRFQDEAHTVLEELQVSTKGYSLEELRKWLGRYLFVGDAVHKKIEVLSGGERARVALAILSMTPSNLLLLDEPTNHLDYITREALESALLEYKGSLLFISHDRYFIDKIATHLWIIDPKEGTLVVRHGNYTEYKERKDKGVYQFDSEEHERAELMMVEEAKEDTTKKRKKKS